MSFSFDYPTPGGSTTTTTTTTVTSPDASGTSGTSRPRQQPGSACDECRRRKLRCDRKQPQCLACVNAGVTCVMRSTCPPRGPKKGHLKALRSQIAALETRLNEQEKGAATTITVMDRSQHSSDIDNTGSSDGDIDVDIQASAIQSAALTPDFCDMPFWSTPLSAAPLTTPHMPLVDGVDALHPSLVFSPLDRVPVGVHLTPKACADLDQLYFDRVHAFAPILQKFRYLSWSKMIHKTRQKLCLQYAMWTLAASLSSQFQFIRGELYTEARQLLDALEMDTFGNAVTGVGNGSTSNSSSMSSSPTSGIEVPGPKGGIEQVQAWLLLSIYEFMSDDYQRGLVSAGRAFRLVQLMRLHEIDRRPSTNLQGDWIDIESTRRTFWLAYTIDRFTSVNDELPLTFNEHEIRTRLPAPDAQFMSGRPTTMCFLSEVIAGTDGQQPNYALADLTVSPFTESVIIATICGRTLGHKQRSSVEQHAYRDVIQDFCLRHQSLNAVLSSRVKSLAMQISSTSEHPDPMLIFVTLTAYMVVLMLCDTVESIPLVTEEAHALLIEYKQKSLEAAHELGMLTNILSQLNHFETHPFTPIPLLLSARFCLSHMGFNDSYSTLLPGIAGALQGLTSVNCLAHNCLRLLGLNVANE